VQHAEVLEQLARAHLRIQAALLGHVADPRAHARVDRLAAPPHRPVVRRQQAADDPHRRRLARPVAPDEAEQRAGRDLEAQPVEGDDVAERPAQAGELEGRFSHVISVPRCGRRHIGADC
jgi:hypothetical protein